MYKNQCVTVSFRLYPWKRAFPYMETAVSIYGDERIYVWKRAFPCMETNVSIHGHERVS